MNGSVPAVDDFVTIYEMAPRDGLQNEPRLVPTADKIALIDMLSGCGFRKIEATSFVSPKWTPQMGDAAQVMAGIARRPGIVYAALTPNMKGYEAARESGVDEVAVFASASEGFSRANINCTIAESFARFAPIVAQGARDRMPARAYISCVVACPYDGPTDPDFVAIQAARLLEMGCYEVSLGDTIGAATPDTTARLIEATLRRAPASCLAGHFHDTRGLALGNIVVCLDAGLRVFDSCVGGLGGCPFAPGAKGNVDTREVMALLDRSGFRHGLDAASIEAAARFAGRLRCETPPGAHTE